jgi:hypothetical protein
LYDFNENDELAWRQAGDSWEPPPLPEAEGEAEEGADDGTYTLGEVVTAIDAAERCGAASTRTKLFIRQSASLIGAHSRQHVTVAAGGFAC